MLGKLIKYEFKATARIFLPFYLAVFIVTLINKGVMYLQWNNSFDGVVGTVLNIISGFTMLAFVMLIIATMFLTFFIFLQRFYKNLYTDEGYLMHTLPVKPSAHIGAKLITSSVWTIACAAVVVAAIFLLVVNGEVIGFIREFFNELPRLIDMFEYNMNTNFYGFIAVLAVFALTAVPCSILMYYFAITLGSIILPKHKIGGAFLGYIIINTVIQAIMTVAMLAGFPLLLGETLDSEVLPSNFMYSIFIVSTIIDLAIGVISFFVSARIMEKKLNLD